MPSQLGQITATGPNRGARGGGRIPVGQNCRKVAAMLPLLWMLPECCPTAGAFLTSENP